MNRWRNMSKETKQTMIISSLFFTGAIASFLAGYTPASWLFLSMGMLFYGMFMVFNAMDSEKTSDEFGLKDYFNLRRNKK